MRYPKHHNEEVRQMIVNAAAVAIRKDGLFGISIPALMKKVGLTHGGFYVHFRDRDELVAEAVAAAGEGTARRVLDGSPEMADMLNSYLSMGHVQHPEQGCVLAALGTEGVKSNARIRRSFAQTAVGFIRILNQRLHAPRATTSKKLPTSSGDISALSDEAILLATRMIGAVVLARLVQDEALSERILSLARSPH